MRMCALVGLMVMFFYASVNDKTKKSNLSVCLFPFTMVCFGSSLCVVLLASYSNSTFHNGICCRSRFD